MTRAIKFRAKSRETGEWVYGDLGQSTSGAVRIYPGSGYAQPGILVTPETVGQFIGVKDIAGADIYEGDIVAFAAFCRPRGKGTVTLSRFPAYWLEEEDFGYAGENLVNPHDPDTKVTVIGNKYDNPTLLEPEEQ